MPLLLDRLVAVILGLGILPSFTALSAGLEGLWPELFRYVGPFNALKLGWPVLVYWIWARRSALDRRVLWILGGAFGLGTLATGVAGYRCGYPPYFLREWSVMCLGTVAAVALSLLPFLPGRWVVRFWCIVVLGSCLLDLAFPNAINWLYAHVFDPQTRQGDWEVTGRPLTGIFGRQSLAKLLSWLPWMLLFVEWRGSSRKDAQGAYAETLSSTIGRAGAAAYAIICIGLILPTTQRGPLAGALIGATSFFLLVVHRTRSPKALAITGGALATALAIAWAATPPGVIQSRVLPLFGLAPEGWIEMGYATHAERTRVFRAQMTRFSLKRIAESPLGDACIPLEDFAAAGVRPQHSHNLLLEQYRSRGWLWGTAHLALWLLALAGAWRIPGIPGAALFSGVIAVLTGGMFDHPWFVLNHAMVLSALITLGVRQPARPPHAGSPRETRPPQSVGSSSE